MFGGDIFNVLQPTASLTEKVRERATSGAVEIPEFTNVCPDLYAQFPVQPLFIYIVLQLPCAGVLEGMLTVRLRSLISGLSGVVVAVRVTRFWRRSSPVWPQLLSVGYACGIPDLSIAST